VSLGQNDNYLILEFAKLKAENARLKAEVERLTSDLQMEKENEDRLVREFQKANNEAYGLKTQVAALIDDQTRLKAEAENFQEYLKWHADGHKFAAWQVWRSQHSDAGEGKQS
jgi:regulator of replication initiation timing